MKSSSSATTIELALFLMGLVVAVLYFFLSTGVSWPGALLFLTPSTAVGYGVLLLWGLPLWRRLYLRRSSAANLVLGIVGLLVVVFCHYSFIAWVVSSGASGINP